LITKFSDSANRRTISQATASDQVDLPRKNTKTAMEHDDTFEKKQKQRLQALHSYITQIMSGMNDDTLSRAEGTSGTLQDDSGSDAYDFDFALNRLSHEANALGEIEEALHRLQLGTYGICEKSGQKIPDPRLEALPFARHTVEVQSMIENQQEITKTRPLHDNHKALKLDDDTLLGISSDMPTEEIRTHLNKLFRKYSNRVSHDDPKIADKARERLMKIGEARARHIDFH
jgi:RNA polymerase-binding transcription factor DksA